MTATTPKGIVFDAATGQTSQVALTADEIAQREVDHANYLAQETAIEAKVAARASALAKLAELGLTEEEIAAL
jgi:hypothetical protein